MNRILSCATPSTSCAWQRRVAANGPPPFPFVGRADRYFLRRVLLVAAFAALLSGCATGFVYNRLDWAVSWYVQGLVQLDHAQEEQLRQAVSQTLEWHRHTQLPQYIELLELLQRDVQGAMSVADIETRYAQIVVLLDVFLEQILPDTARLLRGLSEAQVEELMSSLEQDNEDIWQRFAGATPELRQKRRLQSTVRALQRFTGTLSHDQRQLVATRLREMSDFSEQWIDRRRHWQRQLRALLEAEAAPQQFEARLQNLAMQPDQFDAPDYRRDVEANRLVVVSMLSDLSHTLTPRQRQRFARKLQGYSRDLRRIAAQA